MQKTVLDGITYEIPIKYFETNMNTDSSKEKNPDLFRNHNKLKSKDEYSDIESQLHYACEKGEAIKDDSKNF